MAWNVCALECFDPHSFLLLWDKVRGFSLNVMDLAKADGSVEAWGPAKHGGDCSGQVLRKLPAIAFICDLFLL